MTNTPMTFEEWFEQWRASTWKPLPSDARQDLPRHWAMNAQNHMSIAWQASQAQQEYSPEYTLQKIDECNELNIQVAQQASVIAELVEAMLSASPIIDTITIDRTEYEAMKADAERWRYFRETASEEMCYALCGNSNAENEELDQAIDQARKI